ncbi:AroB 3-dehydroquinate synthetase [Methylophilaceae bacterium]
MSVSFEIHSSTKSYQVAIVSKQLESGLYEPKQHFVLVDKLVLDLYPYLKTDRLIVIPVAEESKSLETVAYVVEQLRILGANRNSHLIAIGGGIIQDIATFTSSIFMRGITWAYYPTTLLGMVDSCVGGKSSINVGQFKNIAGNFYPPEDILIDTHFCHTLQHQDIISGLCEAVKICFAARGENFSNYLAMTDENGLVKDSDLSKAIELTLLTKKKFIEEDEFDTGVRLLLNFGHTFGHAIEAAGNFSITHGVAVGLGMRIALKVSKNLQPESSSIHRVKQLDAYLQVLLSGVSGLPKALSEISKDAFLEKFKSDKKHTENEYVVIIPDASGYLHRHFVARTQEFETLLVASFEYLKGLYEVQ